MKGNAGGLESTLQNQLVVEKVMQALAGVTPQQRLIFLLKHQEGMTYDQIAKELGCSPGTVKKSVSRTTIFSSSREWAGGFKECHQKTKTATRGVGLPFWFLTTGRRAGARQPLRGEDIV